MSPIQHFQWPKQLLIQGCCLALEWTSRPPSCRGACASGDARGSLNFWTEEKLCPRPLTRMLIDRRLGAKVPHHSRIVLGLTDDMKAALRQAHNVGRIASGTRDIAENYVEFIVTMHRTQQTVALSPGR